MVTHNLNSYITCRQNSYTMISSLLSSFCIRNMWIFFLFERIAQEISRTVKWVIVCCLSLSLLCRACSAVRAYYGSCARSKESHAYALRWLQYSYLTIRSHPGMCLSYGLPGTGKFSSTSKEQSLVWLSSTEAELHAAVEATKDIIFCRAILAELGFSSAASHYARQAFSRTAQFRDRTIRPSSRPSRVSQYSWSPRGSLHQGASNRTVREASRWYVRISTCQERGLNL